MLKSKIRKEILTLRKLNNINNIKLNFHIIYNILKTYNLKKKSIGGYYPVNYELDDLNILKELELKKIKVSLPVIKKNHDMDFYRWSHDDLLIINKYGIPEPQQLQIINPDIIFIPLVAFDERLYRIGYGGGYYDRYIEKLSRKKDFLKIGIAHSCQKVKRIPNSKYDKKLDILITEKYTLR